MRLSTSLLAVAVLACATLGTNASAGVDSKTLAGTACQFTDVTPSSTRRRRLMSAASRTRRTSPRTSSVRSCATTPKIQRPDTKLITV